MEKHERDGIVYRGFRFKGAAADFGPSTASVETQIQADIAYELTKCVEQLKRIADHTETYCEDCGFKLITGQKNTDTPIANAVDNNGNPINLGFAKSDTPSCDGLRTAVENMIRYCDTVDHLSSLTVENALKHIKYHLNRTLSASPKPRSCSCENLIDAIRDAIDHIPETVGQISGLQQVRVMARLKSALKFYSCQPRDESDKLADAVKKVLSGDFSFDRDHRLTAIHDILQSALDAYKEAK